jgi:hypothetical protein
VVLQVVELLAQVVTVEVLVMDVAAVVAVALSQVKSLVWVVKVATLIALLPNGDTWNTMKFNSTLALKY